MGDWKIRFINEYKELRERLGKLKVILEKWHNRTLDFIPTCPIELLERQRDVMADYLSILEERAVIEGISLPDYPKAEDL